MTVYELMCCYKSPNWFNYQNPMAPQYDYVHEKIELNQPSTIVDSYLGRLVALAQIVNREVPHLNSETLDSWLAVLPTFYKTEVFRGHSPRPQVKQEIQEYFDYGLPAEWIEHLLQVFILELWTGTSHKIKLNDPKFLEAIRELSTSEFKPVLNWIADNPEALLEETKYKEE